MSTSFPIALPVAPKISSPEVLKLVGLDPGDSEGSDAWCIAAWLQACAPNSEHTRRSYRREALRWLAFLTWFHQDGLADMLTEGMGRAHLIQGANHEHVGAYLAWVRGESNRGDLPQRFASACGLAADRPKSTVTVLRHAERLLNGMYEELAALLIGNPPAPVVLANPFQRYRKQLNLPRRASVPQTPDTSGVAKALTERAWQLLWHVACQSPVTPSDAQGLLTLSGQPRKRARATRAKLQARRRLALAMLGATWDRRSSVAALTWADLTRASDGVWKVWQQRKGSKPAWYPVPDGLISEIALFRKTVGLQAMPLPEERGRSLFWTGGNVGANGPISDESLYRDLKTLFTRAAAVATKQGDLESAALLARAGLGPHTIRHTMAMQYMAAGGQVSVAQGILGHASIGTTAKLYDGRQIDEPLGAMQEQWERWTPARFSITSK